MDMVNEYALQHRINMDNDPYLLSPTYWAYQGTDALASMIPALAAAYATGGASLGAQAAVGSLVGGAQEGTALYTDLSGETDSSDPAQNRANLTAGLGMGLGSAALNAFGKIFGALPPGFRKKFLDVVQTSATEGATEWAENPFQAMFSRLAKGEDADTIVRDLVPRSIGSTFRYSGSPVFDTGDKLAVTAGNAIPETYGETTQLVNAIGALTGLPSSQVNVFRAGLEEWDDSASNGENVYHLFVRRPYKK